MPLYLQHTDDCCRWGIWKIEETADELLAMLAMQTDKERFAAGLQSLKSDKRKLEWLAVRVLLATLAGADKVICYHPSGRPYLEDGSASISISHTQGYAAVILGPERGDVAIDIEQYAERVRRLYTKFMREDEVPGAFQGTDTWGMLLHWSAKETMFKAMDTAEVDFREHLRIAPFQLQAEGLLTGHEYRTEQQRTFLIHYLLRPDFVLTWYCAKP